MFGVKGIRLCSLKLPLNAAAAATTDDDDDDEGGDDVDKVWCHVIHQGPHGGRSWGSTGTAQGLLLYARRELQQSFQAFKPGALAFSYKNEEILHFCCN